MLFQQTTVMNFLDSSVKGRSRLVDLLEHCSVLTMGLMVDNILDTAPTAKTLRTILAPFASFVRASKFRRPKNLDD
jgi:hypothetical protein